MEIETKKYYIYEPLKKCAEFVKDFAHANDLILQGGQSLDYAFRLAGSQLYEDYALPDYDFVSQDSVNLAYKLFQEVAGFLFGRTLDEPQKMPVSVINGMHHTTMKVLVYRDSIADITYVPGEIFEIYKLSALMYNNVLVRHPFIQYIDTHRALSHPYENPMMETILFRWKKDFDRFKMALTMYDPGDKIMADKFISCYARKSKNGPPNLSKLGSGRLPKTSSSKYVTTIPTEDRYKMYQNLAILEEKEILSYGCICGELAFLIYYSLYAKITKKKPRFAGFIKGQASNMTYLGSHYFNNCYTTTAEDIKIIFGHKPVLAKHQKQCRPFMDSLPSRIVSEGFEFLEITHKIGYHTIDLHDVDPGYPRVLVKVVSMNYLVVYMAVMWMIFKHDMYLSIYLKLLRMLKKIYNIGTEECRVLFPSVVTYGDEIMETDEINSLRPDPVYINEHVSPLTAFTKIKEFEYPDHYDDSGV